jgi:uncharacterized protein (DUF2336 family)
MTADAAPTRDLVVRLDGVLSADPEQGPAVLARIEALYAATAGPGLGDDGIAVFDDVMLRLAGALAVPDRAAFATRLAGVLQPPPRILDSLARDPDPSVACPLLEHGASVNDATLVFCARERGQTHLFALSRRSPLLEQVTDLIVERGETRVLVSTAGNAGARFSEYGLTMLVGRAAESDHLTVLVGCRSDLPGYLLSRLIARASEAAKRRLAETRSPTAGLLRGSPFDAGPLDYGEARTAVERLARVGRLGETAIVEWVRAGAVTHAVAGMATLARLPIPVIEAAIRQSRPEPLLLIARSMEWDWATVKAILSLRAGEDDHVGALAGYERLSPETARTAMDLRRNGAGR